MRTIGTFQDVSQEVEAYLSLRKLQKDLAHTESFIDASTNTAKIGLWTVVPATGKTWFFPSFFELLGLEEDRLKAPFDEFLSLIHDEDRTAVADAYRKVCEGHSALFRVDFRMKLADGAFTWFGASARLIEIEGPGSYTLLCGAQIVITDRMEALARVEESSRATEEAMHRLERLAENVPGGIYETRRPPDGPLTVSFFSPTLAGLHGVTCEDLEADAPAFYRNVLPEDHAKVTAAAKHSATTLQAYKVRYRVKHPTSGLRWLEAFSNPTREDDGTLVWHGSTFDVTDDVARQEALDKARAESAYAARHDALTGLPNWRYFDEKMSELAGKMSFAARMGGDEFIIVLQGGASEDSAFALVDRIRDTMSKPFEYDGKPCKYDATFGIASRKGRSVEELLGFADAALYDAKATARGRQRVFDIAFEFAHASKRRRTDEIKRAIDNREFEPFFHPQISAATGQVTGFEVLARWRHPGDGLLPPAAFLEAADHLHVVQDIDRIIFERAQESLCRFRQNGIYTPKLAFNLSPKRIGDPDFARSVRSLNFGGTAISFELLESVLRVRPDAMKIDMRLMSPITHDQRARTLLRAFLEIAASMDIEIIAEGVETMEHAELLKGMGCDLLQGYAFAKPMDEDTTVQFLRSEPTLRIGPEFVVPLGA